MVCSLSLYLATRYIAFLQTSLSPKNRWLWQAFISKILGVRSIVALLRNRARRLASKATRGVIPTYPPSWRHIISYIQWARQVLATDIYHVSFVLFAQGFASKMCQSWLTGCPHGASSLCTSFWREDSTYNHVSDHSAQPSFTITLLTMGLFCDYQRKAWWQHPSDMRLEIAKLYNEAIILRVMRLSVLQPITSHVWAPRL